MKYWISGTGGENGGAPLPSICLYDTEAFPQNRWESQVPGPTWLDTWEDKLLAVGEIGRASCRERV